MEEWRGGGTNSSSKSGHYHHHKRRRGGRSKSEQQKERAGKGVLPGNDITGVVLSVLFQWTHSPKPGDLPRRQRACVCMKREMAKKKNVFTLKCHTWIFHKMVSGN